MQEISVVRRVQRYSREFSSIQETLVAEHEINPDKLFVFATKLRNSPIYDFEPSMLIVSMRS